MGEGNADRRPLFERFSPRDVLDLIDAYPLAWVVPAGGGAAPALLPLLAEPGEDGRLAALFGHMGRRNPLVAAFTADPRATILFTGPQAYLPTTLVSDRSWAPTWNYAQLSIEATLAFVPDETPAAIERLTARLEGEAGSGWRPEMVGARHDAMMGAIIAFRASLTTLRGRFKLGQDERPERFAEILAGHDDEALRRWMLRFDRRRPDEDAGQTGGGT